MILLSQKTLIIGNKDQSLKQLLEEKSNNISDIIKDTRNELRKLLRKAETNINYRECIYLEQKDRDNCKLIVAEFTSYKNIAL